MGEVKRGKGAKSTKKDREWTRTDTKAVLGLSQVMRQPSKGAKHWNDYSLGWSVAEA